MLINKMGEKVYCVLFFDNIYKNERIDEICAFGIKKLLVEVNAITRYYLSSTNVPQRLFRRRRN